MKIDFNFYPERHMDELDGMLMDEVPQGWTLADFIRALYDAKLQLWEFCLMRDPEYRALRWLRDH